MSKRCKVCGRVYDDGGHMGFCSLRCWEDAVKYAKRRFGFGGGGEDKSRDKDDGGGGDGGGGSGGGGGCGGGCLKTIIRWFLYLVLVSIILITVGVIVSSVCGWHYESDNKSTTPSSDNSGEQEKATAELEKEATAWIKGGGGVTFDNEGVFFKFNGYAGEGVVSWTATSKKAIGDCPAGSAWGVSLDHEDGTKSSNFPPKCKPITPTVIIDFASGGSGGSGGGNATEYVKSGTEYLDRGDKNNNKADYDLAIAEFDRAIKLDPNIAEAYFGRGRGYLRKGDNSRAVADYSQAIRLNPNDIISYSNRGRAYARMGDYDNAVADFESALRIDPNNTAIKQNLEKARKKEKGL